MQGYLQEKWNSTAMGDKNDLYETLKTICIWYTRENFIPTFTVYFLSTRRFGDFRSL